MLKDVLSVKNVVLFLMILQFVTAIIGALYFCNYKDSFLKYFLIVLWYTAINDFVSGYFIRYFNGNTVILYNIYQILVFCYILILFRSSLSNRKNKKWISPFMFVYLCSVAIMSFFDSFRYDYMVNSFIIGATFIVISISLYFSEILRSDKIIEINYIPLFWISVAMLVYYVPSIPFFVVRKYYVKSPTIPYIFYLNYFLIFVVNILYIIGFIWSGKGQKA